MRHRRMTVGIGGALLAVAALGACGTSANSTTQPPNATAPSVKPTGPATFTIYNFDFSGPPVSAGQKVMVVNKDGMPHTFTTTGVHVLLDPYGTGSFIAPTTPGQYTITCDFHPKMRGSLVVV